MATASNGTKTAAKTTAKATAKRAVKKASSRRRSTPAAPKIDPFSTRLGIQGWTDLDPILLASLALQAPLLLIGAHGTAKTLVAERIAGALELELRHYNASLLNYDDLVGIPVPDDNGGLHYLGAAGAVWDAQFVFLDEINRCRPDLQNKLFPLVHERRIAGEDLARLQHRWAAINPPGAIDAVDSHYLGVEELDDALIDRFWFIVPVPGWKHLTRDARLALVRSGAEIPHAKADDVPIGDHVARTASLLETVDATLGDRITDYIVTLSDELSKGHIDLSPRRTRLLLRSICAVHAARIVLGDVEADLSRSAEIALLHSLPGRATSEPPSLAVVVAAHRQSWEVTGYNAGDLPRDLLHEVDPVTRVLIGIERGADDQLLSRLVTQALGSRQTEAERRGLAFVFSRALAERALTPAAWGPIAELAAPILTPADHTHRLHPGLSFDIVREIEGHFGIRKGDDEANTALETAFLHGVGPIELGGAGDWRRELETFKSHCERFGVAG